MMLFLELKTYLRRPLQMLLPWSFTILWGILVPMLVPQHSVLVHFAPVLLWMILFTSMALSLEEVFVIEQQHKLWAHWKLGTRTLWGRVLTKLTMYWGIVVLPLTLLVAGLTQLWGIPIPDLGALCGVLALGSLVLTLMGALMAALSQQEKRAAGILGVLLLPLLAPVLIFGTLAVEHMVQGVPDHGEQLWLAGLSCVSLALVPLLIVQALKLNFE